MGGIEFPKTDATERGVYQPFTKPPAERDGGKQLLLPEVENTRFAGRVIPEEFPASFSPARILTARLGRGELYESLSVRSLNALTGEAVARVDTSIPGMMIQDGRKSAHAVRAIREIGVEGMMHRIAKAGELFFDETLPLGSASLDPKQYCVLQSSVTGATVKDCRANMGKVYRAMTGVRTLIETHLAEWRPDLAVADLARGTASGAALQTEVLGAHLPSNSPGVHQLWVPFLTFVPLMLKPGSGDVFSPERIRNACVQAGVPPEAIAIYHGPGPEMGPALRDACKLCMFFGGGPVQKLYAGDRGVDLHGPGYSKVVLGPDVAPEWHRYLPLIERGVTENSGRSCINTSAVYVPAPYGEQVAEALAHRLGPIQPLPLDHPEAVLAAFPDEDGARAVYVRMLERCRKGGGRMVTDGFGARVVTGEGFSFLRPTVAYFPSHNRYTATWEFLAPSVAVVEYDGRSFPESDARTLICTALTKDADLLHSLRNARISLLHEDPVPTTQFDQYKGIETNVVKFLFEPR